MPCGTQRVDGLSLFTCFRNNAAASGRKGASSRLKSQIFSKLISLQQAEGPLRILSESKASGEQLCVFERAVALLPSAELQSRNPCAVCHARVLGGRCLPSG